VSGLRRVMGDSDTTRNDGPLTVQVERAGDALMLRASGELSRSTAESFEAELRQAIDADASTVVLDLSGVGFIDSTGLRVLISAMSRTSRRELIVLRASAQVRHMIESSGVEDLLPLAD
jgi:anti-sigma B factor antagonist